MDPIEVLVNRFHKLESERQRDLTIFGGVAGVLVLFFLFVYWSMEPGQLFLTMVALALPVSIVLMMVYFMGAEIGKREGRVIERRRLQKTLLPMIRRDARRSFASYMQRKLPIYTRYTAIKLARRVKVSPALPQN